MGQHAKSALRGSRIVLVVAVIIGFLAGNPTWRLASAQSSDTPVLRKLHPDSTPAGKAFNVQPDGQSALAVSCEKATRSSVIVFGREKLKTVYGSDKLLTAAVPARLYTNRGSIQVYIENGNTRSNRLDFVVK